ncbi:hypothetical protein RM533_00765 [Croceicoccus sp. F390]|uniref:Flp pilus-assembly TadG-like N-terminal domain-containing protein n=1 Tax=Croceicoccus esteveae TaxID=3075597 RepID=A0ABU2ZGH4_9SPHN|nr:hypothetical protein [Croceicoccus sp. F390]MDT0574709.1 hypothetical protein [Croceicoccus sp. F390]
MTATKMNPAGSAGLVALQRSHRLTSVRAGKPLAWQVILADLALILFILTSAALAIDADNAERGLAKVEQTFSHAQSNATAIWRDDGASGALTRWLQDRNPDNREMLTLVVRYPRAGLAAAISRAAVLAEEAEQYGIDMKISLEPGSPSGIVAVTSFERPQEGRTANSD